MSRPAMPAVLLSLGANQGDRAANLRAAVAGLGRFLDMRAVSAVYETAPMYETDQPAFLNLAVVAGTDLPPAALLAALKALERRLGRLPTTRFGPRPIDIDIVFYDDRMIDAPDLTIPHPAMAERGFVLAPAADVAPAWRHPADGLTVAEMLASLGPLGDVRRWEDPLLRAAG
jgi:2-amino-4-hydroxy-6-hydroxymethyldihydropteridine diphosphokinase